MIEPECSWCGCLLADGCADSCDCPSCDNDRALDDDAEAYLDR